MKKFKEQAVTFIVITLILSLIAYGAGAFSQATLILVDWTEEARAVIAFLWTVLVIVVAYALYNENTDIHY